MYDMAHPVYDMAQPFPTAFLNSFLFFLSLLNKLISLNQALITNNK